MFRSFRALFGVAGKKKIAVRKVSRFVQKVCLGIEALEGRVVPAAFTPGDLAVILAASASASNTTASLVEIQSSGSGQTALQAISAGTVGSDSVRVSGSASSTLYAALTNDRTLFAFTGHIGTATGVNANTITSRGVFTVDTSGSLAERATYTGNSGQQARGATSLDNSTWYIGDQGGFYSNGTSSPSPTGNYRGVKSFGGAAYALTANTSLRPVGTINSATGGSYTALPGLPNGSSAQQDFYLVSSGSNGSTFDVLYILSANSATAGTIIKYSLVNGTWTDNGSYSESFGGFGLAAATSGGGANLFVTTGTGATAGNSVVKLYDSAGFNSPINITTTNNVTLYTAAAGTTIKGVDFAPDDGMGAIGGLNVASTSYTAGNSATAIVGANIPTFIDASNFKGGSLTIGVENNPSTDTLSIAAGNGITVDAINGTVSYGGTQIGTFPITGAHSGLAGADLVIAFNDVSSANSVTSTAIVNLIDQIIFSSTTGAAAGVRAVTFKITQNDGQNASATQNVTVSAANLLSQSITFANPGTKTYGDAAFNLGATASSNLPVVYSIVAGSGFASISGGVLTILGAGTVTVRASQSGNGAYFAATDVDRTFTINRRTLNLAAVGVNKIYSGDTAATVAFFDDRIVGDSITISDTANFVDRNVGTGKTVFISGIGITGSSSANYTIGTTPTSTTADITPKAITGTVTVADKVFDNSTSATITSRSLATIISGDDVSYVGGTGVFASSGVGMNITVTVTGLSLSGADSGNYSVNSTATTTASITALSGQSQFISFAPLPDRTYGDAAFILSATANSGLAVAFAIVSGPAVISGSTLTITGAGSVLVAATQAGDITWAAAGVVVQSFTVAQKSVTATVNGIDKIYDGTTLASVTYNALIGLVGSDAVAAGGGTAAFADKIVGAGKSVTVAGIGLSGAAAENYVLSSASASTTASITAASVTVSVSAANKTYDATTAASVASYSLTGVFSGDSVAANSDSATFDTKNVGTGKPVSVSGIVLSGADAGNYTYNATASATADITAKALTGSVTVSNKNFDGTDSASIASRTLSGAIDGDTVSLAGGAATFDDAAGSVGTNKPVTATGLSLTGADAGNYSVNSTATTTASIGVALTLGDIAFTGYQGSAPDKISFVLLKNVTNGTVLTFTDNAWDGAALATNEGTSTINFGASFSAGAQFNYDATRATGGKWLVGSGVTAVSDVTTANFGLSASGDNLFVYGSATPTSGSDSRWIAAFASNAFLPASGTATNNQTLLPAAFTLGDTAFSLGFPNSAGIENGAETGLGTSCAGTASVIRASLYAVSNWTLFTSSGGQAVPPATAFTVLGPSAIAVTSAGLKIYDGSAYSASVSVTGSSGPVSFAYYAGPAGAGVALVSAPTNVGTYSVIATVAADANYFAATSAIFGFTIAPKTLTATALGVNKVYDGSNSASAIMSLAGIVGSDVVTASGSASFGDKNVGTGKIVSISGIVLSGANAANYTASGSATATANITAKPLTGSVTAADKIFDGTISATIASRILAGVVAGDTVSYVGGTATFATAAPGIGKTVTATDLSLNGPDAGNYTVNSSATTTANIISTTNDAPTIFPQTFTIHLTPTHGVTVGTVLAEGPDGGALTFAITGGNTTGAFAIDSTTGNITVANVNKLPRVAGNVALTVTVTDHNSTFGLTAAATITVTLSTTQSMQPVVGNSTFSATAENNKAGARVGQIKPTAAYKGQTFGYALVGSDAGAFSIDAKGNIKVTSALALNYEVKSVYSFQVDVTDTTSGSLPAGTKTTIDVTVNIVNANDAPTVVVMDGGDATVSLNNKVYTIAIDEHVAIGANPSSLTQDGLVIGKLTAADEDVGSALRYALVGGTNVGTLWTDKLGAFTYDSATGVITVRDSTKLSYEKQKSVALNFAVTDNGIPGNTRPATTKATIVVALNDVNEAPVISSTTAVSIKENNKALAKVLTVKAQDPDTKHNPKDTLTFTIESQKDDQGVLLPSALFSIASATGALAVPAAGALDFETSQFYDLVIRVSDGTSFTEQTLRVNVLDVNEAASIVLLNAAATPTPVTALSLSRSTSGVGGSALAAGDVVGTLLVSDQDSGSAGTIAMTLTDSSRGGFAYDPATGQISVLNPAKLVAGKTYTLTFTDVDSSARAVKKSVRFNVLIGL